MILVGRGVDSRSGLLDMDRRTGIGSGSVETPRFSTIK
jgi:hypothetical protein